MLGKESRLSGRRMGAGLVVLVLCSAPGRSQLEQLGPGLGFPSSEEAEK